MNQLVSSVILDFDSPEDFNSTLSEVQDTMIEWNNKYTDYSYTILKDTKKLIIQVDIYVLNTKGNPYFGEGDSTEREPASHICYGDNYISI